MFAFWLGGASAPSAPTTQAGRRSMFAFWLGGASAASAPAVTSIRIRAAQPRYRAKVR
jgi:hypothetical protein